jgi:hypothetical protein
MGEKRNAYGVLVGKPEGKRPLGSHKHYFILCVFSRFSHVISRAYKFKTTLICHNTSLLIFTFKILIQVSTRASKKSLRYVCISV